MDRSRWGMAGISIAVALALPWAINWFAERVNPDTYPGELAYKPVNDMPPLVDLKSVQRGWPNSLDEPGQRNRLIAYQHDLEHDPRLVVTPVVPQTPAAPLDLGTLLASADMNAGKQKAQVCASCHDFTQGGPDRIGPNLWGVIGRKVASRPGFSYSPAMAAQRGAWNYDRLFTYLESPARAVPGNKMGFAGFSRPEDRAAVIKFLTTLGNSPPPLPQPKVPAVVLR